MKILLSAGVSIAISFLLIPEATAQTCCSDGKPEKWKLYNRGVRWYDSLEEAKKVAAKKRGSSWSTSWLETWTGRGAERQAT